MAPEGDHASWRSVPPGHGPADEGVGELVDAQGPGRCHGGGPPPRRVARRPCPRRVRRDRRLRPLAGGKGHRRGRCRPAHPGARRGAVLGRRPKPFDHAVLWVLSPSDNRLVDELHAKIKSKMDSAKLLGTFLTALLVFAARELSGVERSPGWYPWVAGLALVLLALATAAYFVTMFLYDELLMPVRFWPSRRPSGRPLPRGFVARPPSSAGWVRPPAPPRTPRWAPRRRSGRASPPGRASA